MDVQTQPPSSEQQEIPNGLRDPSKLFYQSNHIRRTIVASYWIIIFLAIPLWWHTTSIERLSLPPSILAQASKDLSFPINVQLCVDGMNLESLGILRRSLNKRIAQSPQRWEGLHVQFSLQQDNNDQTQDFGSYMIRHREGMPVLHDRQLDFPLTDASLSRLADLLSTVLVPDSTAEHTNRVIQYSSRYRLAFSLLNEDSTAGAFAHGWEISSAISRHISPILQRLSVLHNFTIESQVQYHAPLAFQPKPIEHAFGLTREDLTIFINSAQWTLESSASNDPVLHFVLFIPAADQRPLRILNSSPSSSDSFLIPQWGGIVIFNPPSDKESTFHLSASDLNQPFSLFSEQLLTLLGVPHLPPDLMVSTSQTHQLTDWQLDTLIRRRTLENARSGQDTLNSIVKLVNQIENMPVGRDVRDDVQDALAALEMVYVLAPSSLIGAFQHSVRAFELASRAFFNPGMLALLYFPAEHKYAVYTPLFASAVIPLIAAALREVVAWRKESVSQGLPRRPIQ